MPEIVALDPGKATGIAVFDVSSRDHHAFWFPYDVTGVELTAMAWLNAKLQLGNVSVVVSESIVITAKTAKKSQDVLASIEQIGIARWLCACYDVIFVTQTPSEGLGFGTDSKLHALDWWSVGVDHPRSASRHLLTYLCKTDSEFARDLAVRLG